MTTSRSGYAMPTPGQGDQPCGDGGIAPNGGKWSPASLNCAIAKLSAFNWPDWQNFLPQLQYILQNITGSFEPRFPPWNRTPWGDGELTFEDYPPGPSDVDPYKLAPYVSVCQEDDPWGGETGTTSYRLRFYAKLGGELMWTKIPVNNTSDWQSYCKVPRYSYDMAVVPTRSILGSSYYGVPPPGVGEPLNSLQVANIITTANANAGAIVQMLIDWHDVWDECELPNWLPEYG